MNPSGNISVSQAGSQDSALRSMERFISELPLLPQVMVRILQLSPTADDYFEQFEELAKEDPAFAVRIVALANSAASAPASPICTIRDALARMGAGKVRSLVASLSVQRVFMPTDALQVRLWKHSIETAVGSQMIARMTPELEVEPGQAYLTGLLHDIGRFVMLEHAAPELQKVDESNWQSLEDLVQADIEVFKFTHSELGFLACKNWGLPDTIANVVRAHHDPMNGAISPGSAAAATFCVQVADRIGISLLERPDIEELSDQEMEEIILADCLHTDSERSVLSVSTILASIADIRVESSRLLAGLGFN
jgi:putative nucleotidyltransferase with HDIG domain